MMSIAAFVVFVALVVWIAPIVLARLMKDLDDRALVVTKQNKLDKGQCWGWWVLADDRATIVDGPHANPDIAARAATDWLKKTDGARCWLAQIDPHQYADGGSTGPLIEVSR